MPFSRPFACVVAIGLVASLGACSGIKKTLGMENQPPDEFTVVARAPLEMPPDYGLRPPRAGAIRTQEQSPTEVARTNVFRVDDNKTPLSPTSPGQSPGEAALLKQAGADRIDPNIRRLVNQDSTKYLESDRSFIDKLIFWRAAPEPGVVVDPTKESERLRQNAALGKAPTSGETPIVERKKKGLLEGIF